MTTWAALLRGVNVNGITIHSADLAELFHTLGFSAVKTVLASGNVRFDADAAAEDRATLKTRIEQALRERFGYDAWIVLVTATELAAAADGFPFDAADAQRQPYLVFCASDDVRDELARAAASLYAADDPVAIGPGVVYWNPEKGRSVDTAFARVLARSAYKASTTTRNLRTVRKMLG
ncbi:DUF1697 domain-containing protein [Microbacterium protaetiae]|uniref:DUF1697 domain-containing protein n=1 Tax=Microbacterium protaetiae TaxID=2509458 RepID=A0A4P6EM16_9MICO|nr:DUF1697 domain-containing protein [Microbacterium protaetiae]QAY61277.1 DUF1697 domain-containing protein [Microbacterium protaetiae]